MLLVRTNAPAAGEGFIGVDGVPDVLPVLPEGVAPLPVLGAGMLVRAPQPPISTTTTARTMIVRDPTIRESLLCIRHLYPAAVEAAIPLFRASVRMARSRYSRCRDPGWCFLSDSVVYPALTGRLLRLFFRTRERRRIPLWLVRVHLHARTSFGNEFLRTHAHR